MTNFKWHWTVYVSLQQKQKLFSGGSSFNSNNKIVVHICDDFNTLINTLLQKQKTNTLGHKNFAIRRNTEKNKNFYPFGVERFNEID